MIKVNINTLEAIREDIPQALVGLSDHSLRNLQSVLSPIPVEFLDIEFWPPVDVEIVVGADEKIEGENLAANAMTKTVNVTPVLVPKTSEDYAAEASIRLEATKQECARRILGLMDLETQSNLQGEKSLDGFDVGEAETYAAGYQWTKDMRAQIAVLVSDPSLDISLDSNWPAITEAMIALCEKY